MDWKAKLTATQDTSTNAKGRIEEATAKKIEEHWPRVQQLFQEKVGPAALAAAHNDETVTSAAKLVHEALPFPLRMVVKQDTFVEFCLAHRDKLVPPAAQGTNA
jgi:hypothetical protein